MIELSIIQKASVWVLPVLFAITLHEAAHAWVAAKCGDTTAKMLGRLTINPIKHIDLIGTIIVPIVIAVISDFKFIFGWAKPVPINWSQLAKPKRDMALVALAGPAANIVMAIIWAAILKFAMLLDPRASMVGLFLFLSGQAGMVINLFLAALNLLPIPPLDGSRIITSFLKPQHAVSYLKIEPYGFFILLLLIFTNVLFYLIVPPVQFAIMLLRQLFNI
jgi:Zn-dependent protease